MAAYNLAPIANFLSIFGSNTSASSPNVPLAGGTITTYAAGTSTLTPTYQTNLGTAWGTTITLDSTGRVPGEIWFPAGQAYKFVLKDSAGNVIPNGTLDNLTGVNDTSALAVTEWIASGVTPTYSSGTVFTTAGNTTAIFQVGRRIQATVTAGTVYGTITASSFGVSTTVTLAMDPTMVLDNGLSAVNYGFLGGTHPSVPPNFPSSITTQGSVTAATGISATTGNISAASGNVSASGSVTAGTLVTAATSLASANWNADLTTGYLRNTGTTQIRFQASQTNNTSNTTTTATTAIPLTRVVTNIGSGWTSPSFTAPVTGLYYLYAGFNVTNTGATPVFMNFYIGSVGTYGLQQQVYVGGTTSNCSVNISGLVYLAAATTVSVYCDTTFTASLYLQEALAGIRNNFGGVLLF